MKFISSRELRINPGAVWKLLRKEKDLVITSNGKPAGVLTAASEEDLEEVLATLRQGRAQAAIVELRRSSAAHGTDRLTDKAIASLTAKTRLARRRRVSGEGRR